MKKLLAASATAAIFALSSPLVALAAEQHGGHTMENKSTAAYEAVIDGVKATFNVQSMADAMKGMKMDMPKGMKETHHISVAFKDVKKQQSSCRRCSINEYTKSR